MDICASLSIKGYPADLSEMTTYLWTNGKSTTSCQQTSKTTQASPIQEPPNPEPTQASHLQEPTQASPIQEQVTVPKTPEEKVQFFKGKSNSCSIVSVIVNIFQDSHAKCQGVE